MKTAVKRALLEAVEVSHGRAKAARVSVREIESVQEVRQNLKLPRAEFARLLGVSVRTVEGWEQGRRNPSGAAKMLLRVAVRSPKAILDAWHSL